MNRVCHVFGLGIGSIVLLLLLVALPALEAQHHEGGGGPGPAGRPGPAPRPEPGFRPGPAPRAETAFRPEPARHDFERDQHGSIRHAEAPVIRHERFGEPRRLDFDIDRGHHFFDGFIPGAFVTTLPFGYQTVVVNGAPYDYYGGTYYQPQADGYQEVYPPVGAAIAELPEGAVPIAAANGTYYYAGGAFYVQQGPQFVIVAPPVGVTVPQLPPGAAQVVVNGQVAWQFDGIYLRPVFVNGVTMYVTFVQ